MRLSKQTEYGLRAIVQLGRMDPRAFVQSRDLASQETLPNKFLEAILLTLRRGGFLESKVGRDGGYRLARHPREISIGDLVRRLEGRMANKEERLADDLSPGELAARYLNHQLTDAMDAVLDRISLEQLIEHVGRVGAQQQSMYYI